MPIIRSFPMKIRLISYLLAAGIFAACGDSGDDGGGPNNPVTALFKASGDNQNGAVNTALTNDFCVRVTEDGANAEGVTVTWSTPSGGSMSQPTSLSNGDGIACARLTLGITAGAQTAIATVSGANGSPVTFNATGLAGNATTLVKGGGDNQTGSINSVLAEPISVQVTDAFGNGVQGALVTWLLSSGSAGFDPTSGITDVSGFASTMVTLGGAPGPISITASSAGLTGSPQTFSITSENPPPAPNAITIAVQNNQFSPLVDTVAAGGSVTWDWPTGSGPHSVTSTGTLTFTSDPRGGTVIGPANYGPLIFSTPGTYFYYCTVHGSPGSPPTGMSGTIVVQ
jgi:plastocyanin